MGLWELASLRFVGQASKLENQARVDVKALSPNFHRQEFYVAVLKRISYTSENFNLCS